jgi:hypothetical protein
MRILLAIDGSAGFAERYRGSGAAAMAQSQHSAPSLGDSALRTAGHRGRSGFCHSRRDSTAPRARGRAAHTPGGGTHCGAGTRHRDSGSRRRSANRHRGCCRGMAGRLARGRVSRADRSAAAGHGQWHRPWSPMRNAPLKSFGAEQMNRTADGIGTSVEHRPTGFPLNAAEEEVSIHRKPCASHRRDGLRPHSRAVLGSRFVVPRLAEDGVRSRPRGLSFRKAAVADVDRKVTLQRRRRYQGEPCAACRSAGGRLMTSEWVATCALMICSALAIAFASPTR